MNRLPLAAALLICAWAAVPGQAETTWWTDLGARERTSESTQPDGAEKVLRLLAPRNGMACGQIVVRRDKPLKALSAQAQPLGGGSSKTRSLPYTPFLEAETLEIAYLTNQLPPKPGRDDKGPLTAVWKEFIPSESHLGVVYVTANIPAEAEPGLYKGSIRVTADGESFDVPVSLEVSPLKMPPPAELEMWISLMQSPAQLSFAYDVKPYSEEHWEKIAASTRLLGQIGHHVLYVPVLWHANVGSGPQMVLFAKDGDSLKPDLAQLERYFKLVAEQNIRPRMIVLGVWGRWIRPGQRHPRLRQLASTLYLTEIKPDGTIGPLQFSSDYQAHEAMWKKVYQGAAELADKHLGVKPEQIVLGFGDDVYPDSKIDAFWQKIAPKSPGWDAWTHNYGGVSGPRPVFYQIVDTAAPETVDELLNISAMDKPFQRAVAARPPMYVSTCRGIQHDGSPAVLYYSIPDLAATPQKTGHSVGLARIGLDYWPKTMTLVSGRTSRTDGFGKETQRSGRAFPGRVARDYRSVLTARGPDGAVRLIHFDALRQGVQAAQARIVIAKAIADKHPRAAELRKVLELQFEKGARHRTITLGRDKVREVTTEDLHGGWKPLFEAAAGVSE
ncbi:MAG: glycoside hydrolase domain-containing protein [Phycisphaerae bacterium]